MRPSANTGCRGNLTVDESGEVSLGHLAVTALGPFSLADTLSAQLTRGQVNEGLPEGAPGFTCSILRGENEAFFLDDLPSAMKSAWGNSESLNRKLIAGGG